MHCPYRSDQLYTVIYFYSHRICVLRYCISHSSCSFQARTPQQWEASGQCMAVEWKYDGGAGARGCEAAGYPCEASACKGQELGVKPPYPPPPPPVLPLLLVEARWPSLLPVWEGQERQQQTRLMKVQNWTVLPTVLT